jgi:hypothetical protein
MIAKSLPVRGRMRNYKRSADARRSGLALRKEERVRMAMERSRQ